MKPQILRQVINEWITQSTDLYLGLVCVKWDFYEKKWVKSFHQRLHQVSTDLCVTIKAQLLFFCFVVFVCCLFLLFILYLFFLLWCNPVVVVWRQVWRGPVHKGWMTSAVGPVSRKTASPPPSSASAALGPCASKVRFTLCSAQIHTFWAVSLLFGVCQLSYVDSMVGLFKVTDQSLVFLSLQEDLTYACFLFSCSLRD